MCVYTYVRICVYIHAYPHYMPYYKSILSHLILMTYTLSSWDYNKLILYVTSDALHNYIELDHLTKYFYKQ